MGLSKKSNQKEFTIDLLSNRDLMIKMLKHEDQIIHSDFTKNMYEDHVFASHETLSDVYAIHRKVLSEFDFNTSPESVENYRKIFDHYYKSPTDYDQEVLNSVTYMRENRCVYYTEPIINIGDVISDDELCELYNLDGTKCTKGTKGTKANLSMLGTFEHAFIAGFSMT